MNLFDWLTVGIAISCVSLCIWGVVKADKLAGKVVSGITGLAFLTMPFVLYFVFRAPYTKCDYKTKLDVCVLQGTHNQCLQQGVQNWEDWLVSFWAKHYPINEVMNAISDKRLYCSDLEEIGYFDKSLRGLNDGQTAVIGWKNGDSSNYTRNLYDHEMSHFILIQELGWNEKMHHDKMIDAGLEGKNRIPR